MKKINILVLCLILCFGFSQSILHANNSDKYPKLNNFLIELNKIIKENKDNPDNAVKEAKKLVRKVKKSVKNIQEEGAKLSVAIDEKIKSVSPHGSSFRTFFIVISDELPAMGEFMKLSMDSTYQKTFMTIKDIVSKPLDFKGNSKKSSSKKKSGEKIKASHILIAFKGSTTDKSVTRTKKEALEKIKQLKLKLNRGADFTEIAKKYSDCPSSKKGGDLGFFSKGMMVLPFEVEAFTLKVGEISDIVETRFGYHIILRTK